MAESDNGKRDEEGNALLMLQGQADIWKYMFSFADSMALKSVVELGIADIIHHHGGPISLVQIIAALSDAPSPDITCLERIMRLLVRRRIFSAHQPSDGGETLYDLTYSSRWLLRETSEGQTLFEMIVMMNHPSTLVPWNHVSHRVRASESAFKKAHGCEIWEYASENPEYNKVFNDSMECTARIVMKAVTAGYKDGFESMGSLVDVGGGIGWAASQIVKSYPHIKCINFDLPHVIATAPQYHGVTHVGGDMFHSIPQADVVFMKSILIGWGDDESIRILKNCRRAIRDEEKGKVVIVEFAVKEEGNGMWDEVAFGFDMLMITHSPSGGGMVRTELQWKNLLPQAGFPRYNFITIPTTYLSIIEAFPL